jgi:hypothetical protein
MPASGSARNRMEPCSSRMGEGLDAVRSRPRLNSSQPDFQLNVARPN